MTTLEDRRPLPVTGGALIAQRYELGQPLAQGGMATIWHGWDRRLARPVAVKTPRDDRLEDDGAIARLRHEALTLASLAHPNIVSVYDLLEVDGRPFLIMEMVEGEDLKHWMRRHGALDPLDALDIARQVCLALQAIHTHGIVHRDVKPHNILLTRGPYATLVDFGLALSPRDAGYPEEAGVVLGTPEYMAPEQAMGGQVIAATDLYALGITLYEALAGETPFRSPSAMEIMRSQVSAPITPLRQVRPDLPRVVEAVVMRALEKDAGQRFPSAEGMAKALSQAAYDARLQHDALTFSLPQSLPAWWPPASGRAAESLDEADEESEPLWVRLIWVVVAINIMLALTLLCAIVLRGAM
ncbi:MAG TPA: serine/threonine-protein kinase [Ktedonobacterales bacterium]|jgi:serine/threonine-protein kinase